MTVPSDLDVNQLLAEFLDGCRDDDGEAAFEAIHKLRGKIWYTEGKVLPRDPRQQPEELVAARERITETERLRAENKRLLAASVALAQCRDILGQVKGATRAEIDNQVYEAIAAADAALK